MRWILLSLIAGLQISCSIFTRHEALDFGSGSENIMNAWYPMKDKDYIDSLLELGINDPNQLTPSQEYRLNQKMSLKNKERSLQSSLEKEQYYKYQSFMQNDKQRLDFLKQASYQEREIWARNNNLNSSNYSPDVKNAIDNNDIIADMPKQAVLESWGEPDAKDTAGDPLYGNERWKYIQYSSTPDGYILEQRYIYFENSKVKSWVTEASN